MCENACRARAPQVNRNCCEDNADALTHHELLMPGQLLAKFVKEKLEDCLELFVSLVKKDLGLGPATVAAGSANAAVLANGSGGGRGPESVDLESETYLKKV